MRGRLPDDALSRTTPESRRQAAEAEAWDVPTELLAQLVDLTAILAADRRIKGEPNRVERPDFLRRAASSSNGRPAAGGGRQDGFAYAIGVLRSTSKAAYVTPASA